MYFLLVFACVWVLLVVNEQNQRKLNCYRVPPLQLVSRASAAAVAIGERTVIWRAPHESVVVVVVVVSGGRTSMEELGE